MDRNKYIKTCYQCSTEKELKRYTMIGPIFLVGFMGQRIYFGFGLGCFAGSAAKVALWFYGNKKNRYVH